jgi:glycosyltransferase involved in cell wall biosynthesis
MYRFDECKSMTVLHILNELKPSGAETMLLSAAPAWIAESEQHILSTGEVEGAFAAPLREAGYQIHHLPFSKTLGFFRRVGALFMDEDFDVIHLHTERASLWYAITARLLGPTDVRVVRTVHHLFQFDGLFRLRRMFERQFMKRFLGVAFLSNSPSGQRNEKRRFRMSNALAPNWYDSQKFRPPTEGERRSARQTCGFPPDTTIFVSLGGNWGYKNYNLIVRALGTIPKELKVLYVQVGVQGEGSPLETLAKELGVSDRLHCTGVVEDALIYLRASDVYLMPSSEEGFGVAAVEAMASGLPAILSDVEALCDFRININGIRYIEPDVKSIAEAMEELARMPDMSRRELGSQVAQQVETHYGLKVGPFAYMKTWRENG